ncbi:hypothetical protein H9Q71_005460 [Fusarium xylarioides]|nr:hypothetical protein H9Q71_005460 [Fusarium xylarioides]
MESSKDNYSASASALALSKVGLGPRPGTKEDNFYTPRNEAFYSKYKYCLLGRERPTIRLLKVYPKEKTLAQHIVDHPNWKASGYDPAPVGFSSVDSSSSQNASSEEKLLACDMIDGVFLSNCTGKYLALSYAAGDPKNTARILVGGHIFNAFAQLVHALKCAVRYWYRENGCPHGHFLFWVDQICINQSDDVERGHQVMMMRDIYSRCETALVCLSTADEKKAATTIDHQDTFIEKYKQFERQHAHQSAEEGEQEPGRGTSTFSFEEFEEEVEKQVDSLIKELTAPDMEKSIRTVAAMMNGRSKHDSQVGDLRVLLRHARNFRASDTRDKIYAFVGLARDDYSFKPSYSHENTAVDVHSDAARRIVEIDKDLNYVLEQAFVGRRDLGFFLPSWVPDWNCSEDRDIFLELQNLADGARGSPVPLVLLTDWPTENQNPYYRAIKDKGLGLLVMGRHVVSLPGGSHEISPNLQRFETDSGLVIYAPRTARPKDEIWSLSGCEWLVFLQGEGKDKYCFGGFVVVHGLEEKSTSENEAKEVFLI